MSSSIPRRRLAKVSSIALLSCFVLDSASARQGTLNWWGDLHSNLVDWVPVPGSNDFGPSVVGRFRTIEVGSAALLVDRKPYLFGGIDSFNTIANITTETTNDLLAYRPAGDTLEDLFLVTASGLKGVSYDETPPASFQTISFGDSVWNSARRCISRDMDGNGHDDLIGISADGLTGLVLYHDGSGWVTPSTTFSLNAPATDLIAVDYSASANPEIFFLNNGGIDIHRANGTYLTSLAANGAGGSVELLEYDDGSERIAWATKRPNGIDWELRVFDLSSADTPLALDLAPLDQGTPVSMKPISMVAFDHDGDGNDDLAFATDTFQAVPILFNRAAVVPSEPNDFSLGTYGTTYECVPYSDTPASGAAGQQGHLGIGRTSDTGGETLFAPLDVISAGLCIKQRSSFATELETFTYSNDIVELQSGNLAGALLGTAGYELQGGSNALLTIYFNDFPWDEVPAGFTHLQVIIWQQDNPVPESGGPSYVYKGSEHNYLFGFPGGPTPSQRQKLVIPLTDHIETCMSWDDARHKYLEMRAVKVVSAGGPVVKAYTESLFMGLAQQVEEPGSGCQPDSGHGDAIDYFLAGFSPQSQLEEVELSVEENWEPAGSQNGSTLHGGILILDYIPPFEPESIPTISSPIEAMMQLW